MSAARRPTQKRNKHSFLVTWPKQLPPCPDGWPAAEWNALAGKSYRASYPSRDAMDVAAEGFQTLGAAVTS